MQNKLFLTVFVTVVGALVITGAAPAEKVLHLKLDTSIPEADQVLKAPPKKIVLKFSQRPELTVARIEIQDGKLSKVARSQDDETILWVAVEEPLAAGTHTVKWVTSSSDGHPVRGEFSFMVSADR